MYTKILLSCFLYGIYSYYTYVNGGLIIPFTFSMISGVLLIAKNPFLPKRYFHFFVIMTIFLFVITIVTIGYGYEFWTDKLTSLIVFEYSLLFSLYFLKEITKLSNKELASLFYYLALGLIVLCAIHLFIPSFQIFQENFVTNLYGRKVNFEHLLNRDIAQHGGMLRPYPFTSEPSHVGKFIFVSWSAWLLLSAKRRYSLFFIVALVAFLIVRSPTMLPLFFIGFADLYYNSNVKGKSLYLWKYVIFLSLIIIIPVLLVFLSELFQGRIQQISNSQDISTMYRLILPFSFVKVTLLESPIFGIGISNLEYMVNLYNETNDKLFFVEYHDNNYYLSDMLSPLVYFGLLGTLLFFLIFRKFFYNRNFIFNKVPFVIGIIALSNTVGNFHGLIFWVYVFIFYRACIQGVKIKRI